MTSLNYIRLKETLNDAFLQASEGKGAERHANVLPFEEQRILAIARDVGPGFLAGQIEKKAGETCGMLGRGEHVPAYREALSIIVYGAALAIFAREMVASAPDFTEVDDAPTQRWPNGIVREGDRVFTASVIMGALMASGDTRDVGDLARDAAAAAEALERHMGGANG